MDLTFDEVLKYFMLLLGVLLALVIIALFGPGGSSKVLDDLIGFFAHSLAFR